MVVVPPARGRETRVGYGSLTAALAQFAATSVLRKSWEVPAESTSVQTWTSTVALALTAHGVTQYAKRLDRFHEAPDRVGYPVGRPR